MVARMLDAAEANENRRGYDPQAAALRRAQVTPYMRTPEVAMTAARGAEDSLFAATAVMDSKRDEMMTRTREWEASFRERMAGTTTIQANRNAVTPRGQLERQRAQTDEAFDERYGEGSGPAITLADARARGMSEEDAHTYAQRILEPWEYRLAVEWERGGNRWRKKRDDAGSAFYEHYTTAGDS
jgi:hypothetical protein